MSAGKGDKLRKGADLNKYWSNYDAIFRKCTNHDTKKSATGSGTTSKGSNNSALP